MYQRLLIPLDGSRSAESILPAAVCLSKSLNARVVLIHIIEQNAPQEVHGEEHLHDTAQAEAYLGRISNQWFHEIAPVETHVHAEEVSNVAGSILQHVGEFKSDLTLMCTHGKGGARRFLYGSIAQKIAAAGVPVLFVRQSSGETHPEFTLGKLLVPLDGDPDHEQSLAVALDLAGVCKSSIHLLTVVPSLSNVSGTWTQSVRLQPSTTERMLRMEATEAEEYLESHGRSLKEAGVAATTEVRRGDSSDEIVSATSELNADLIILGTHGTVGTEAFWEGSVTARIARKTIAPVLLVPAAHRRD